MAVLEGFQGENQKAVSRVGDHQIHQFGSLANRIVLTFPTFLELPRYNKTHIKETAKRCILWKPR